MYSLFLSVAFPVVSVLFRLVSFVAFRLFGRFAVVASVSLPLGSVTGLSVHWFRA